MEDAFSVPFILSCLLLLLRVHPWGERGTRVQAWYMKSFSSLRLNLFSFLPLVCKILLFSSPRVALKKEERTTARGLPFINSHKQGWRSVESTRLPPMWPGLKSRRRRHMWVEFVVGSLPWRHKIDSKILFQLMAQQIGNFEEGIETNAKIWKTQLL